MAHINRRRAVSWAVEVKILLEYSHSFPEIYIQTKDA